jgi:hypothetical protein
MRPQNRTGFISYKEYFVKRNNLFEGWLRLKERRHPIYGRLGSTFDQMSEHLTDATDIVIHFFRAGFRLFAHDSYFHLAFIQLGDVKGLRLLLRYTINFADASFRCLQAQGDPDQENGYEADDF